MSTEDLREKYGKNKKAKALYNAAIRNEVPGGNPLLDLLEQVSHMKKRQWMPETAKAIANIEYKLQAIRNEMVEAIQSVYGIKVCNLKESVMGKR